MANYTPQHFPKDEFNYNSKKFNIFAAFFFRDIFSLFIRIGKENPQTKRLVFPVQNFTRYDKNKIKNLTVRY